MAFRVARMLKNGMGGFDLAGLPLVCAWLGIEDVDGLLLRIEAIANHRKVEAS